jgi:hypothetical protein
MLIIGSRRKAKSKRLKSKSNVDPAPEGEKDGIKK